jgi:hypothetical protein
MNSADPVTFRLTMRRGDIGSLLNFNREQRGVPHSRYECDSAPVRCRCGAPILRDVRERNTSFTKDMHMYGSGIAAGLGGSPGKAGTDGPGFSS